ncbi:MAG: phosphodiester glycosidase family protein [Bacteroides sp.]|nr:phosphodiester glycosidase family protein [Bacteroides sp.]MBD5425797.1 phosphodiester glycosidase family protein [Bacteroides sp.]
MNKNSNEISENEIRIISAKGPERHNKKKHTFRLWFLIILGVLIFGCVVFVLTRDADSENDSFIEETYNTVPDSEPQIIKDETTTDIEGFTIVRDTIINKKELLILTPEIARPRLIIGNELLNNPNIILATQAADVRGDNGQIAGTFVLNGELISKGEAKAGFCSITDGELSIGVADATPMLEQALTEDGYFFRQYPLVVGGQIVENKPKGKAIRKALAEIGGRTCVVMSKERLTFQDFSQLLVDMGVRNAIYLVGSSSYGFYVNEDGNKILTGEKPKSELENVNYIIWEKL